MTVAETRIEFVYTSQLTLMMLRSRNTAGRHAFHSFAA